MANNQVSMAPQYSLVIHEDLSEADNISTTVCPLCNTQLKLFQIHYDEKFLMCGNIECVYPFGVTDLHIYKIECNEEFSKSDTKSNAASITSCSVISNSDWSDFDKVITNESGLHSPEGVPPSSLVEKPQNMAKLEEAKKSVKTEETIKKNVKRIKELNKVLFQGEEFDCINNETWIKHIAKMQERSGVQLLKENELNKVKKSLPKLAAGDLKIDYGAAKIAIKIEGNGEIKKK